MLKMGVHGKSMVHVAWYESSLVCKSCLPTSALPNNGNNGSLGNNGQLLVNSRSNTVMLPNVRLQMSLTTLVASRSRMGCMGMRWVTWALPEQTAQKMHPLAQAEHVCTAHVPHIGHTGSASLMLKSHMGHTIMTSQDDPEDTALLEAQLGPVIKPDAKHQPARPMLKWVLWGCSALRACYCQALLLLCHTIPYFYFCSSTGCLTSCGTADCTAQSTVLRRFGAQVGEDFDDEDVYVADRK